MTDKETQALDGVASVLNAELDVEDGLMCVFVDDTEISHYLRMHINDQENMEGWQENVCYVGAETIDKLRAEVKKLRAAIKQEAHYCYAWAANAEVMGDYDRSKRHKERLAIECGDKICITLLNFA